MCRPDLFEELYDKWRFAKLAEKLSLPHPATELVCDFQEVNSSKISPPILIKPRKVKMVMELRRSRRTPSYAVPSRQERTRR